MYRAAWRATSRPVLNRCCGAALRPAPRRLASTAPPGSAAQPRSWKNTAARWGIAIAGVYFYNTSSVFADEDAQILATTPYADSDLHTVDTLIEKRKRDIPAIAELPAQQLQKDAAPEKTDKTEPKAQSTVAVEGSVEALEEEAGQEGAFNPETGEINWDCPCLGGMAHGPCGEEFKTAFSCFVYSNEEPKGMDCIDKFQGMQECFRKYPDIYGAELEDSEAEFDEPEAPSELPAADTQTLRDDRHTKDASEKKPEAEKLPVANAVANGGDSILEKPEDVSASSDKVEKEAETKKHEEVAGEPKAA